MHEHSHATAELAPAGREIQLYTRLSDQLRIAFLKHIGAAVRRIQQAHGRKHPPIYQEISRRFRNLDWTF
jgi:hypothetical protein